MLGLMTSILGEHEENPENREELWNKSEKFFRDCTRAVDHEPPSALDHNNFADLFMKRRKYEDAFAELKKAVDEVRTPNALFCKTSADIFWKRRDTSNALRALGGCTATDALLGSVQDVKQYVENQIFAAKLVAASPEMAGSYLPLTTSTLESVSRFVDEQKTLLGSSSADELQTKVLELLGFAYLQMPGSEDRAVKSFDLLRELGINAPDETQWQRQVGLAKALLRCAATERRNFSLAHAAQQRERASTELAVSETKLVDQFALDATKTTSLSRRRRYFRLHMDTMIVNQELAEESFYQNDLKAAQSIVEHFVDPQLARIDGCLKPAGHLERAFGPEKARIDSRLRLYRARKDFLLGQILIRSDPQFANEGTISAVEERLKWARGANSELDCRIELALGEMLLSAALLGKGDLSSLYARAIDSLEAAIGKYVPALRAETLRALTDAYAKRDAVRRKSRDSKKLKKPA